MHAAGVAAGIGQAGGLGHGQSVHVGTQTQAPAAVTQLERPHDTRAGQAALDRKTPTRQPGGDEFAGFELLQPEFGVGMDETTQVDHLARVGLNAGVDRD